MRNGDKEIQINVYQSSECTWYHSIVPFEATVAESGTPGDWYIATGEFAGRHVLKEDCTEAIAELEESA